MDASIVKCNNLTPKLRKNKRIEGRWGIKYHTAVKNAVFGTQGVPYMPLEPPPSLNECVAEPETLYVCQQCKDCFRFLNSFEEHSTRRSWILGFWCQHCFLTICTHMTTEGSPCSVCLKLDRDKRLYLRARGLHKSHKLGAVRVFYNQCQFFAHLKTHHVTLVDMGDLMLMPLPTNIDNDWPPELDIACEALMEHAFVLRTHIMDLLIARKVENNWWQLATNKVKDNDNPVTRIIKGYKGRFFFDSAVPSTRELCTTLNARYSATNSSEMSPDIEIIEPVQSTDKGKTACSTDVMVHDFEQNIIENEDNPCTPADIAFVDCGPASKCFEPEIPMSNIPRKHTTIFVKSGSESSNIFQPGNIIKINSKRKRFKSLLANYNSSDMALSYGNTTITPKRDVKDTSDDPIDTRLWKDTVYPYGKSKQSNTNRVTSENIALEPLSITCSNVSSPSSKLPISKLKSDKFKQNVHSLTVNSGQKILTFQSTKNLDFNTIIHQLPSRLINSKRIVLIGQDSESANTHNKQESRTKKLIQVVPDAGLRKNTKTVQAKVLPLHVSSDTGKEVNKDNQKVQSDVVANKTQQSSYPNKVVYRNGRKYVIKQSSSSSKSTSNASNLIILTTDVQGVKHGTSENSVSALVPLNSNESDNASTVEKKLSIHNDIVSPLTPSPSPSELSSSSSCDIQSKQTSATMMKNVQKDALIPQLSFERNETGDNILHSKDSTENLSFHKGEGENLYLDIKLFNQKPHQAISDTCVMITKCKQEMLNEFFHLSYSDLKRRYEHLQDIIGEISNVMNFVADNVIKENLKAVNILQHVLKHCMDKTNDSFGNTYESDVLLDEWESEYSSSKEKSKCGSCNKILKPKSYIPGFSALPKDDASYCSCYKHICHKCLTYEGNSISFVAHRNYHAKEKPYMCPDCYRKFPSFKMLEFHTWTVCFHTLKKRVLGCKVCEINGFRDMESIARHFAIMHSHTKIACDICYLVLPSYSEYKKHCKEVHSTVTNQEPIRLVLCKLGQCIVRYENYMSHMEKHLVVQRLAWFKCPFCPFINLEAKRILSHFQNKHLERLPEILSTETLWDILPVELVMNLLKINPQSCTENSPTKFVNAHEEPCADGTVVPKIINTRTITSEVFERGEQEGEDGVSNDNINSSSTKASVKARENGNLSLRADNSNTSKVVDAKSCKVEGKKSDVLPKILNVRSIATGRLNGKDIQLSPEAKSTGETQVKIEEQVESTRESISDEILPKPEPKTPTDDPAVTSTIKEVLMEEDNRDTDGSSSKQFLSASNEATTSETETPITSMNSTKKESNISVHSNESTLTSQTTDEHRKEKKLIDEKQIDRIEGKHVDTPAQAQKLTENTTHRATISKPPPLARIPQHVLERNAFKEFGAQVAKAGKDRIAIQQSRNHKTHRQALRRIALNEPLFSKEKVQNFSCHLCGELINTSWSVVSAHYKSKHSQDHELSILTPKLLRISQEFINDGYKEVYLGKKRKLDNTPTSTKRRRRWTPKKYSESKNANSSGVGLCVQQETAEDGEGNFKCKKCDQRCTDMADLREHIASNHRIKGRYLICLECGENFVVAPSLQMHLKAFHGIEDPITYMAKNTSYAPDNVDDLEIEGKTTIANQCYVCMAVFEDKAAVDKHLRVHGMAFLNRKRIEARNALKSPEKRTNGAEEKESPIKDTVKQPVRRDKPAETILEKINATI